MFSGGVKSLLNKPRVLYTIYQTRTKCCYHRKLVYNNRVDLRYLSSSRSSNTFLELCRGLSTVRPKVKDDANGVRSRFKNRQVFDRRSVSIKMANLIYTSHGMSDSSDSEVNWTKKITSNSTSNKKTLSGFSLQNPPQNIPPQIADLTEIPHETLLQHLKDEATSSARISQNHILELENAFVYNLKELTIHEMFSVARHFFLIKHRAPRYLTTLFEYIDNNFDEVMSVEGNPLLRVMFYVYFHGSCPETLLQKIELHLSAHLDELSLNDIGLACLGYFRANRRIRSFELLDQIAEKTIEKFDTMEPHHLINILKSFRHSGYSKISYFEKLADLLVSNRTLSGMWLNQVMHVVMSFASTKIYHAGLIQECMQRSVELVESSTSVRTKELGRIVWAVGTLGVEEGDLSKVQTLIDAHTEIEKTSDGTRSVKLREYPESISDTVMGSVFLQIFPHELISLMLEEKTVNILQGLRGLEKRMQMLLIHHSVNIECPNYSGPKLKQFMLEQFGLKDRERAIQFELDTRPGLPTLLTELTSILGEKKVHCHMILPHFTTADIEIHLDAENRPVFFEPETLITDSKESCAWKTKQQVTSDLLQLLRNPLQKQESSNSSSPQISRRIAVEVTGRNQCALNESKWLLGNYRTKIRQLSAMGYEVLLLMPVDITNLEDTCPERRKEWVLQNVIQKLNINCDSQNL